MKNQIQLQPWTKTVSLILLFAFSANTHAADCMGMMSAFFTPKSKIEKLTEFQYVQKIDRLERLNNRLRNFRDPSIPALTVKSNKKLVKLDSFILSGDMHTAERELAPLFRRMEMSFLMARNNQVVIDHLTGVERTVDWGQIKKLGFSDEQVKLWRDAVGVEADSVTFLRELNRQRNRSLREMGLHYHDYRVFREHLDELSEAKNCTPACLEAIAHLMGEIGIQSKKEQLRFPSILKGAVRPTLAEIRDSVHSSPIASLARLRRERNAEIFMAFWTFLKKTTLVDAVMKKVSSFPIIFERLFKSIYDQQAREKFFPEMNRLLRADLKKLDELLEKLKAINAKFEGDEFLVNLSRRIDGLAKDYWLGLKEEAAKLDPNFLDRMLKAEVIGARKGELTLTPKPTLLNKFTLLLLGGAGVTYYTLSPGQVTVTPLPDESDLSSMPVDIEDEQVEKQLEELGQLLEENERIFAPKSEADLGYHQKLEAMRFPAAAPELETPPGAFTKWFKHFHWQLRGKYLWP